MIQFFTVIFIAVIIRSNQIIEQSEKRDSHNGNGRIGDVIRGLNPKNKSNESIIEIWKNSNARETMFISLSLPLNLISFDSIKRIDLMLEAISLSLSLQIASLTNLSLFIWPFGLFHTIENDRKKNRQFVSQNKKLPIEVIFIVLSYVAIGSSRSCWTFASKQRWTIEVKLVSTMFCFKVHFRKSKNLHLNHRYNRGVLFNF